LTLVVEASLVSETGTFSSFKVKSVKGPNPTVYMSAPYSGGGSMFLRTVKDDGIEYLDGDAPVKAKVKLF
jgi:hypothetical protein